MVFKIRDKSLFWTRGGWKNNWAPKSIIMPKNMSATETSLVTNHKDHHSFLRSNFHHKLSGAILQKLLKNFQTIYLRR